MDLTQKCELRNKLNDLETMLSIANKGFMHAFYLSKVWKSSSAFNTLVSNHSSTFHFISVISHQSMYMELYKLTSKNEKYSINKLFNCLKYKEFGDLMEFSHDIENWEQSLIPFKKEFEKITTLRNQIYAHRDHNWYLNFKKNKIDYESLKKILIELEKIITGVREKILQERGSFHKDEFELPYILETLKEANWDPLGCIWDEEAKNYFGE